MEGGLAAPAPEAGPQQRGVVVVGASQGHGLRRLDEVTYLEGRPLVPHGVQVSGCSGGPEVLVLLCNNIEIVVVLVDLTIKFTNSSRSIYYCF